MCRYKGLRRLELEVKVSVWPGEPSILGGGDGPSPETLEVEPHPAARPSSACPRQLLSLLSSLQGQKLFPGFLDYVLQSLSR